jgi:type IV pilus assembly protein PilP
MWKKYSLALTAFLIFFSAESSDAVELYKRYRYQIDERSDPFLPFIRPRPEGVIVEPPLAKPENRGGVPLEPGQLKLAAIIRAQDGWKAMAEDVTGKGYVLQEGTLVGSYATVSKIEAGQVLLEEAYTTKRGTVVKKIALRLQQEGGK